MPATRVRSAPAIEAVQRSTVRTLVGSQMLGGLGVASGIGVSSLLAEQARYAATDLAGPDHRGRALSVVVWATTVGAVLGPNLVAPAGRLAQALGLPPLSGAFLFSLLGFLVVAALLFVRMPPTR